MDEHVEITSEGHITKVLLNRPDKRNAITQPMYAAMAKALADHGASDQSRVLVFTGVGEAFTAGNDLFDFYKGDGSDDAPVLRFLSALLDCPKPVVAAVNGMAIGIGLTMLLHCDLAIASSNATFSAPFASLALVPEAGSSLLLPQALGMAMANDVLLTGRTLNAEEALQHGLVSRVYDPSEFEERTTELVQAVASLSPTSLQKTKALIRNQREFVRSQMSAEAKTFAEQLNSADFAESVAAKMQKRKPNYA